MTLKYRFKCFDAFGVQPGSVKFPRYGSVTVGAGVRERLHGHAAQLDFAYRGLIIGVLASPFRGVGPSFAVVDGCGQQKRLFGMEKFPARIQFLGKKRQMIV